MYQGPETQIGSAVPIFNSSAVLPGEIQELTSDSSLDDAAAEAQVAADHQGWFQITNLFKSESVCGGNLSIHKCSLHHAVVEYSVVLSNGILSLRNQNWQDDNVLFQTYVLISTYLWKCLTDQVLQSDLEFPHNLCSNPGLVRPLGSDRTLGVVVPG
jgi:hypothetical protein